MPRFARAILPVTILIAFLTSAGLAQAQTLTASPASLTITAQTQGQTTSPQPISITSGTSLLTYTATSSAPWLVLTQATGITPGILSVQVNPSLLAAGTYNGTITVTAPGSSNGSITIPVMAVVGSTPMATVNPTSLTFDSSLTGGLLMQTISVTTSGGTPTSFLVSASSAGNWLTVDKISGTTPGTITASVTPGSLAPGTYTGSIIVTVPGATNATTTIPVTLKLATSSALTVSPTSLTFNSQLGQAAPAAQSFTVSAGTSAVVYTAAASITNGSTNWLSVNSSTGTTPGTVSVAVNPAGLSAGTYTGAITISAPGTTNPTVSVPVTLNVSSSSLVTATPASVSFNFQSGGAALVPQTVTLTTTGTTVPFTAAASSTGNWLQVSPTSGTAPANLTITADPTGLATGTYTGAVTLTLNGAGVNTISIPVTLSVNTGAALTASPSSVSFAFQTGLANPVAQTVNIGSTAGSLTFTTIATATTGGTQWLTATGSGTTPGQVQIAANPAGLPVGSYTGTVTVSSTGASNTPLQIPVTLFVSNGPLLTVSPTVLSFTVPPGGSVPAAQSITVGSTTPGVSFIATATTTTGSTWLNLSASTGVTPAPIAVSINPAGLAPGNYTGTINISSTQVANSPQTVMVMLTVGSNSVTLSPAALTFTQTASGAAPAAQNITIGNPFAALSFTAAASTTSGGNWLSVAPTSGSAPGQVAVSVNGSGLAAGTYMGAITITPAGAAAQTVPVTLIVGAQQTLSATPTALTFASQSGSPAPATQTIAVAGTAALPFTVATSGGTWLSATPASGTTPASVTVSVNPAGLAGGTYNGSVTITSTGATNPPVVIPVALTVTTIPTPSVTALVNAASFLNGPVSPGEIVTLGGTGIGPTPLVSFQLTASGTVPTTVGTTQVLFDGIAAPVIYASATQTSVVVPYELAGRVTSQVQVVFNGVNSNLFPATIGTSAPGIFAANSAGTGQGAILNQNASVNSSSNPASAGQVIVIYATGEGDVSPRPATGSVTGTTLPKPNLPVTVTIGGLPATVNYAGAAPGLVAGVFQVNAVVPAGAGTGNVPVSIKVGNNSTPNSVTVALQ